MHLSEWTEASVSFHIETCRGNTKGLCCFYYGWAEGLHCNVLSHTHIVICSVLSNIHWYLSYTECWMYAQSKPPKLFIETIRSIDSVKMMYNRCLISSGVYGGYYWCPAVTSPSLGQSTARLRLFPLISLFHCWSFFSPLISRNLILTLLLTPSSSNDVNECVVFDRFSSRSCFSFTHILYSICDKRIMRRLKVIMRVLEKKTHSHRTCGLLFVNVAHACVTCERIGVQVVRRWWRSSDKL